MSVRNLAKDILLGVAVGDALGVPVEFKERYILMNDPVTDMRGYGTHQQPPGTWSDDSSLTFCLAEVLCDNFDLHILAEKFVAWMNQGYWTPHGVVFDAGLTTRKAISFLKFGIEPELAGLDDENSNGNGSLMRILPLLLYISDKTIHERFNITRQISSITHRHIRSVISCFYYLEFAKGILSGADKFGIYSNLQEYIPAFLQDLKIPHDEISRFDLLLTQDIHALAHVSISSSGYVVDTLEASIWCLLTTDSYGEAALKAVNLGNDTDTVGAVTGGLAGLLYGWQTIPEVWLHQLARISDIENLAEKLWARYESNLLIS